MNKKMRVIRAKRRRNPQRQANGVSELKEAAWHA